VTFPSGKSSLSYACAEDIAVVLSWIQGSKGLFVEGKLFPFSVRNNPFLNEQSKPALTRSHDTLGNLEPYREGYRPALSILRPTRASCTAVHGSQSTGRKGLGSLEAVSVPSLTWVMILSGVYRAFFRELEAYFCLESSLAHMFSINCQLQHMDPVILVETSLLWEGYSYPKWKNSLDFFF
jgi:hypothetical protein